jgi:hypothetical protein
MSALSTRQIREATATAGFWTTAGDCPGRRTTVVPTKVEGGLTAPVDAAD